MLKINFLLTILFSLAFSNPNEVRSNFNKSFINQTIGQYQYKIPVYQNETTSLIGIYSPNNETIILEYLLDFDVLRNNVEIYNQSSKNQIKNIKKYFFDKSIIKGFTKQKLKSHLNKCNVMHRSKPVFSQGLVMIFRYYMDDEFYTEFKLNQKICENYGSYQ